MRDSQQTARARGSESRRSLYTDLLRGYRFSVCGHAAEFEAGLAVRREVYNGTCGYEVPVPDAYDERSWLLIAEHVDSGKAIGTMRITPRSVGRLEAEEYFWLPPRLRSPRVVEVTRFAILPAHRKSEKFLPAVSFGLFKLMINFVMDRLAADFVVVCSKEERIWTYEWLRFQRSGIVARYEKLGNAEHELLTMDIRRRLREHRDHRLWNFLFETEHPEIVIPDLIPGLGASCANAYEHPLLARIA
jgi:N-acyl-L-homoserine lactone synthetase